MSDEKRISISHTTCADPYCMARVDNEGDYCEKHQTFAKAWDFMKSDWWETMRDDELKPPMSQEQIKVMDAFTGKRGIPPEIIDAIAGSGKTKLLQLPPPTFPYNSPPYRMDDKGDINSVEDRERIKRMLEMLERFKKK